MPVVIRHLNYCSVEQAVLIKELGSGQNNEPEVKTTYQYVLDLQNN
jgi:hypothetical protein